MEHFKRIVHTLEHILSTKNKRHIVGGILLSSAIFFGGLALTAMSVRPEEDDNEQQDD
jgi:hypothetical protein